MDHSIIADLKEELHEKGEVTISVAVSPGAHTTTLHDVLENGVLKIRIAKPADKGKANKELIRFIAATFDIPQAHVDIIKGEFARLKVLRLAR